MNNIYILTDASENVRDMFFTHMVWTLLMMHQPKYGWNVFLFVTGAKLEQLHQKKMNRVFEMLYEEE